MNQVKKNFIYNIFYQVLILILPFITAPYLARVMGAEGVGVYSYSYSVVYYFLLFALLGINNYGNRSIAKVRDDKEKLSKTFISIYLLQITTTCIAMLCYTFYLLFIVKENAEIAQIQIIYLISTAFDVNWFFFGIEKFKLTVTRNTIIKIISVVLIFLFVKSRDDLIMYTLIMSISTLVSQLVLWPYIIKNIKKTNVEGKDIIKHIKPCIILFIPVLSFSIYKIMDKIMLGNMISMSEVGFYENAEKIITAPTSIITALGTVMMPKISNLISKNDQDEVKRYMKSSIEFVCFIATAMILRTNSSWRKLCYNFLSEQNLKKQV